MTHEKTSATMTETLRTLGECNGTTAERVELMNRLGNIAVDTGGFTDDPSWFTAVFYGATYRPYAHQYDKSSLEKSLGIGIQQLRDELAGQAFTARHHLKDLGAHGAPSDMTMSMLADRPLARYYIRRTDEAYLGAAAVTLVSVDRNSPAASKGTMDARIIHQVARSVDSVEPIGFTSSLSSRSFLEDQVPYKDLITSIAQHPDTVGDVTRLAQRCRRARAELAAQAIEWTVLLEKQLRSCYPV